MHVNGSFQVTTVISAYIHQLKYLKLVFFFYIVNRS